MGKFHTRVYRKDQASDDHAHKLPDGSYTGGSLLKPNSDRTFPHTHLYTGSHGETLETCPSPMGGDHVHESEKGMSSGPVAVRKDSVDRRDFITREGSKWLVKSETGKTLGTHPSKEEAVKQLQAVEANK